MSMYLSPADLADLTGKVKPTAQARELDHMGIPYRRRRDGTLAVLSIHAETVEGAPAAPRRREPRVRFDA